MATATALTVPTGLIDTDGRQATQAQYDRFMDHLRATVGLADEDLAGLENDVDALQGDFATFLKVSPPDSPTKSASEVSATLSTHESAVQEIVGLIRAKFEDEGDRNLRIGQRAFEHAQWQRGNFAGYSPEDFDNLMNRVRDEVRVCVAISPKAIKLGEWVRCHVLKDLVRQAKGEEVADNLSFFEYRSVYGTALSFDKANVEGSLVEGWLDFVMEVHAVRAGGGRITSEDFLARIGKHQKALADAKAPKVTPEQAAALKAVEDAKSKVKATSKATESLTATLSDAFSSGLLPVEAALGIVENVAKHHGVPMPILGLDPAKMTKADCDKVADGLFKAGQFAEMVHLRDRLSKMIDAVQAARLKVA